MARRKQAKPKAFTVGTPSDVDALASSTRFDSIPENQSIEEGSNGLVAAIWKAACQDQAYYEDEQRVRGEAKRKRQRGGGRRVNNRPANGSPEANVTVDSAASVALFANVRASKVDSGTNDESVGCSNRGRKRKARGQGLLSCSVDEQGKVLVWAEEIGAYALELDKELVEDILMLLRGNVITLVADTLDIDGKVGLGVTKLGFSSDLPSDARQCLKRLLLIMRDISSGADSPVGDVLDGVASGHQLPHIVSASMDEEHDTELDASRLYELIKPSGEEESYVDVDGRLSALRPTLHGYQKRVLRWMVGRETTVHYFDDDVGLWVKMKALGGEAQPCFYVHMVNGALAKASEYAEKVRLEAPKGGIACDEMGLGKTVEVLALIAANPKISVDGERLSLGVDLKDEGYADSCRRQNDGNNMREMACVCGSSGRLKDDAGLPEDLLVIRCSVCGIYQHMHCVGLTSFSRSDDWKCTGCCAAEVLDMGLLESNTTLIVCPMPILSQWQSEIDKHVMPGTLRVVTYLGQELAASSRPNTMVTPQELASADIVLTTYDTLRKDLHRNPDKEAIRSLRYTKRYHAVPTPLTSIKFWRIVVDEAQMVESSTAKATEMVRKIAAVNHWAVTGTPISRGLEDLHGLFAFLGLDNIGWYHLIQGPLESGCYDGAYLHALTRLIKLLKPGLGGIMWRSSKKDVAHELRLPHQTECHNKLRFSNIEKHFYHKQHQSCCTEADKALAKSRGHRLSETTNTRQLTKREERKLLLPLLRLRQACVHPQVGAGGLKSLSHVKTPMSMIEVLSVMVGKAKVEAEDAQRLLLSTINGLAGLEILQERFAEAASRYRSVLKISKENGDFIRMDQLQTLHTVYNLTQILDKPGVARTLDDDKLAASIEPLEKKYLGESTMRLEVAESELVEVQKHADDVVQKFVKDSGAHKDVVGGWWVSALALIVAQHDGGTTVAGEELVARIKKDLNEDDKYRRGAANAASIADSLNSLAGMQQVLGLKLNEMDESRSAVISVLKHLGKRVAQREPALIDTAAHCGTCRSFNATSGIVCEHCHFNKDMMTWEMRLFSLVATKYVTYNDLEHGPDERGLMPLDAEDVAAHAHRRAMHRVGVGGLGESGMDIDSAFGTSWEGEKRRSGRTGANKVSNSTVVRRPSQTEHVLRTILNVLRRTDYGGLDIFEEARGEFEQEKALLIKAAESHLAILELRRKEYLKAGTLAMAQRQVLYALDELNMSRMRMKIRGEGQVLSAEEERYMIHPLEIPAKVEEFENELVISEADLSKALGTLKYLKFLERLNQPDKPKQSSGENAPAVPVDPCPVCHDEISDDLAMLPCGHILCVACNLKILEKENRNNGRQAVMKCPTCRSETPASETAVVVTKVGDETPPDPGSNCQRSDLDRDIIHDPELWRGEETLDVVGGYGTKLDAVLRRVKIIRDKLPEDKMIIFSTWQDALDILAHALDQNHIPCLYPKTRKAFDQSISQFRLSGATTAKTPRVLLLLLKQGGNGLNLQEAQHVLFLEPVMDPGEEAQAIGRVNRMGQMRQTFVHRFTFRDSIEENVCRISAQKKLHENCKSKQRKALSVGDVAQLLS